MSENPEKTLVMYIDAQEMRVIGRIKLIVGKLATATILDLSPLKNH